MNLVPKFGDEWFRMKDEEIELNGYLADSEKSCGLAQNSNR
jgi:hypothetical protein